MRGQIREHVENARRLTAGALFVAALAGPALAESTLQFTDETKTSGITSVYGGDYDFTVGGGVSSFDCNGDGFSELFIAGGENRATLYQNESTQGGELKFKPVPSGLEMTRVLGGYPLDINADGIMDLVLLRSGENVVMKGLGNCRFTRANEEWNFVGGNEWSTAYAATFEKGANWPTIAIGNYVDRFEEISPWGSCTDNWLHRPDGDKTQFAAPLPLKPSFCPLSIMFTDWARRGTPDLRVSNDRQYYEGGQEQMWKMEPGQPPVLYTDKDGWRYVRIWGMGMTSYDLDFDQYPEYFLTSMADNRLQKLAAAPEQGKPAKPAFKEVAFSLGLTAHRPFTGEDKRPSTAWHSQFEDVNNDGRVDLFIAKGNVAEMPDFAAKDPNNLLVQGEDGKFVEMADKAGVASMNTARGALLTDLNLDGKLDLVVVNRWVNAEIWRNTSTGIGHFMAFRLNQPGPNRDGIGAWLEVKRADGKVMRRELYSGGGHVSGALDWWHVGVGDLAKTEVRVLWPDGEQGPWETLDSDAFYVLERGKPARLWTPASTP
ncbi:CRTAC1 family protein [Aestuariivirga sp.]|uniref:CRTAC1 family protein n=1 Tax=Aestuariivirga sp. TaxID=2650926 RepID=UPI0039E303D7